MAGSGNPVHTRWSRPLVRREFASVSCALAAVAGLGFHLGAALPLYRPQDRLAGWLLLVILLGAIRHHLVQTGRKIPVLVLVTLQIYIFYGIPQFSQDSLMLLAGLYSPTGAALTAGVWLVVVGELAFLVGYWVALRTTSRGRNLFDRWAPAPRRHWAPVAIAYAGVSVIVYSVEALRPDYVPLAFRYMAIQIFNAYLSIPILFFLRYRFGLRMCGWAGWGLVVAMTLVGLIQGVMGSMVFPFFAAIMCLWVAGRAIRVWWFVVIVLGVVIVNPVKNQFRQLSWQEKDISSAARIQERVGNWSKAFGLVWVQGSRESADSNIRETASRSSELLYFFQVIDSVPTSVPYRNGEGLATIASFWIPRFIWPSKPRSTQLVNDVYAIEFGVSSEAGVTTSTVAVPPFLEGYWNFGILGVVVFLGVYGVLLGIVLGNSGKGADSSVIVCIAFLGPSPFPLTTVTLAVPQAVVFAVASCATMGGLALFVGVRSALTRTASRRPSSTTVLETLDG
jgi:hypothetical protein